MPVLFAGAVRRPIVAVNAIRFSAGRIRRKSTLMLFRSVPPVTAIVPALVGVPVFTSAVPLGRVAVPLLSLLPARTPFLAGLEVAVVLSVRFRQLVAKPFAVRRTEIRESSFYLFQ